MENAHLEDQEAGRITLRSAGCEDERWMDLAQDRFFGVGGAEHSGSANQSPSLASNV
jgi:hypothetical protein